MQYGEIRATVSHPSTDQHQHHETSSPEEVFQIWLCGATLQGTILLQKLARLCPYRHAVVLGHQSGWESEIGAKCESGALADQSPYQGSMPLFQ